MTSWLSPGAGLLRSIESALEKVDSSAANTLGKKDASSKDGKSVVSSNPKNSPSLNDEALFDFLNAPIKEAKEKRQEKKIVKKPTSSSNLIDTSQPLVEIRAEDAPPNSKDISIHSTSLDRKDSATQPLITLEDPFVRKEELNEPNNVGVETPLPKSPSMELLEDENSSHPQKMHPIDVTPLKSRRSEEILESSDKATMQHSPQQEIAPQLVHPISSDSFTNSPSKIVPKPSNQSYDDEYEALANQNSDLQLENKLLRSKVVSLNQELSTISTRMRNSQQEIEKMTASIQDFQKAVHDKDKQISKMRRKEEEFDVALVHKNTQLTALQVKLEEDMKSKDEKVQVLQSRLEHLNTDKASTVEAAEQSTTLLNAKIEALEKAIHDEQSLHADTRQTALERERELESNVSEMTKGIATTQRALEEKSNELMRLNSTLKESQDFSRNVRQELADYKVRATKVLQEKERTIKELTEQISSGVVPSPEKEITKMDLIKLEQERDALKRDYEEIRQGYEDLQNTLLEHQSAAHADSEASSSSIRELEDQVDKERKRVQSLQIQSVNQLQEISSIKEEAERQSLVLQQTIKTREEEIQKLKRQLAAKSFNSSSQEELENRLQMITEQLIQKQNQLEGSLSEKAYLQLQLENTLQAQNDKKNRDVDLEEAVLNESYGMKKRGKGDEYGPRQRSIASLIESSPSYSDQSEIGRRVVGAAHFLDSLSTITGKYLRHYPLARLAVIFYMFILHLWVFYLFFTWNPEVHELEGAGGLPNPNANKDHN